MHIRIDNKLYNFPAQPTNEDIYDAVIIDGVPTWELNTNKQQQKKYDTYKKEILNLKSELEFNTFLLELGEIDEVELTNRKNVVKSDFTNSKNKYNGVV